MRAVPIITRRELERSAQEEALVFLVAISHPDLPGVIRLVTDAVDYGFEGATWSKSAFDLTLLTEDDEAAPKAVFSFPNVNRRATAMLMKLPGRLRVDFRVMSTGWFDRASAPRRVKPGVTPAAAYEARHCTLSNVTVTAAAVTGELRAFDMRNEAWPARRVTLAQFPGVFFA